ncbi:hypothetical protein V1506DRAFT_572394 [Lipomyces tetrasporus]
MPRGLQGRRTRVMGEINIMPDSTPIIDQENDKRVKLDAAETESTFLAKIQKEMSVTDSQALSNYEEAFTLLKGNPPEQRLDIQLPYEKFLQLDNAFSELKSEAGISEDQRYPSLTYNSLTQTVTVVTAPVTMAFVEGYLSPRRTRKDADGGFIYEPMDGEAKMVIAVQVGYTEAYGKLLDDKDMWINGSAVNVVVLVCFKEKPRFKHPATSGCRDITDWRAEKAVMSSAVGETAQLNVQQGYYGPLEYRNHMWAGELTEVFIEFWRQYSHNRMYLIREGFTLALDDLHEVRGLRIRDFDPHDIWQREAANIQERVIPFDSASFLDTLRRAFITLATDRFDEFLFDRLGLR